MDHPLLSSEPDFGPWREASAVDVARALTASVPEPGRRGIIAVDGRSGGGKTTAAGRLESAIEDCVVVHTDDIAWHHSFFGWSDLMIGGVLEPARRGEVVAFRPPAWIERSRPGSVDVGTNARWVIVEGVGAARRELMPFIDSVVWVHSDFGEARTRGIDRDGGDVEAREFWDEWMSEELPFLDEQRPWTRADVIVNGTPESENAAMEVAAFFYDRMQR